MEDLLDQVQQKILTPEFTINIGTYNIRNITDRYEERKDNLRNVIESMNCDILGLQEVSFTKKDQSVFLNLDNKYEVIKAPLQIPFKSANKCFNLDGNVVFIKKTFLNKYIQEYESKILHFSPNRNAHLIKFKTTSQKEFVFINTHLHHIIEDSHIRKSQIDFLFEWIDYIFPNGIDLIIIGGDFNMGVEELENHKCFTSKSYFSVYKKVNGQEPHKTFPTGIICDTMDTDPPLTTDYIFIYDRYNRVKMESAQIFGDKCINNDNTLYPSDHYAIVIKNFTY